MLNVFGEEEYKPIRKYGIIMPNYFIVKSYEISEWRVKKVWIRKLKRMGC